MPTLPLAPEPSLPNAITSSTGFLVKEVFWRFRHTLERTLHAHALRPPQYLMLLVLRDEGTMAQHALGQRLGLDRTTGMQLIQALADRGYVTREDDPSDRRVYRLSLTTTGRRLATQLEREYAAAEAQLLAPLSGKERSAFASLLRRLLDASDHC